MKGRLSVVAGIVAGLCLVQSLTPLSAHHSFSAEFDSKQPISLKGTISKMMWVNPHAWLYVDVKGADGKVTIWKLEFGLPAALYRRGWRQKDLPVGTEVSVEGYRAKDGTPTANARSVILSDGRRLFAGTSGNGAPDDPQ